MKVVVVNPQRIELSFSSMFHDFAVWLSLTVLMKPPYPATVQKKTSENPPYSFLLSTKTTHRQSKQLAGEHSGAFSG